MRWVYKYKPLQWQNIRMAQNQQFVNHLNRLTNPTLVAIFRIHSDNCEPFTDCMMVVSHFCVIEEAIHMLVALFLGRIRVALQS